jgi:putative transposase
MSTRLGVVEAGKPDLSVRRQCQLLGVNRSTWYASSGSGPDSEGIDLMNSIDRIYTECPWYGSRRICAVLRRQGVPVNRKRVQRLMRLMGIAGAEPFRSTSKPHPQHKVFPYLLRGVSIDRTNQVWSCDITYIPLARGFMYLVAIIDWHIRYVLAWELSNTLDSDFCVKALQRALDAHGTPEIFNTDQGAQFTSEAFVGTLRKAGVRISMDGRGRCLDNVFVERLWRSVKYEDIYMRCYTGASELYRGLIRYFHYYNHERPHQSLGYRPPAEVYLPGQQPNTPNTPDTVGAASGPLSPPFRRVSTPILTAARASGRGRALRAPEYREDMTLSPGG